MTITAFSGPLGQFGTVQTSSAGTGLFGNDLEHNPQRAPMFSDLGDSMMDPRVAYSYKPGGTALTVGLYNNTGVVDYVPTTVNTSAFFTSTGLSSAVSGAFTLAASTANGLFSTTIIAPETGTATGTLIAIDSTAAFLTFGSAGSAAIGVWNPAAGTGRNITIRPSSNLDGGTFTIAGRDMYGYKMTETIAGGSTTLTGKKAFKYISSITNASTPTSTAVSIGFGDVYGFPLAVPYVGFNSAVNLNSSANNTTSVTLSTATVILASTASVQTSTTPDVRGTFGSSTPTNGVIRLQMVVTPTAQAIASINSTNVSGLFGATQFSSV